MNYQMKQVYLSAIVVAVVIGQAHARIGFTLEECRKAYGKEVKSEVAWSSPYQRAYGFVANELYIYSILSVQGKVVDITYFNNAAKVGLPTALKAELWNMNVDKGRVWDDTFYRTMALNSGWDGKHVYKKLGQEAGQHFVMYEANGPSALVENGKALGWQIRTIDQFNLEQKTIKQLAAR